MNRMKKKEKVQFMIMVAAMLLKIIKIVITAVISSVPLLLVGVLISFLVNDSQKSLDFILFVIGAIPIALFSPGVFSSSKSGALHTPVVIYRLVGTLKPGKKHTSDRGMGAGFTSSLNLVLAGAILLVISCFV